MTPTREQVIEQTRGDFERYFLDSRRSKGASRRPTFMRYEHDGTYIDDHTQRHWWTWQQSVMAGFAAGRAAGLGEAVEAVLSKVSHPDDPNNSVWSAAYDCVANECAAAIDQLKEQK